MKDDRHIVAGQLHVELEHEAPLRGVAKRRHRVLAESRLAVDDRSAAVGLDIGGGDRGPGGEAAASATAIAVSDAVMARM